jgi:hypothetical protein
MAAKKYQRVKELTCHILEIKPHHVQAREFLLEALVSLGEHTAAVEQARTLYALHLEAGELDAAQRAIKFVVQSTDAWDATRRWSSRCANLGRSTSTTGRSMPRSRRCASLWRSNRTISRR